MRKLLLSAVAVAAAASPVSAQQPQYLSVHQEVAKPSMVAQYEATAKEFMALVKTHRARMPNFYVDASMSPDFTYTYVLPLANMAMMDTINAEFGALAQAAGPAFMDINKRGGAATEYWKESIVQYAPELSYRPAQPRLKPEEVKYVHYDFYYLIPGREPEGDQVAADYVKLAKSKNVALGWNMYKAVIGPELPLLVVAVGARDAADFAAENGKSQAAMGAEGEALNARALALTRRLDQREAMPRPDLSLRR